jgi:hypothetical protein
VYDSFSTSTPRAIWSSKTNGQGKKCFAHMQTDGNLVVYSQPTCWTPVAVWSSKTNGRPGAFAQVQHDGNLVVYDNGTAPWASNSVQNHTIRPGDPDPRHPGCVFERTATECKFGTILMCQEIFVCSDTPHPRTEVDSHVCGLCLSGIF